MPFCLRWKKSSPPGQKSETMYSFSEVWNAYFSDTMKGCVIDPIMRRSVFVCSTCLRRRTSLLISTFMA
jgi:hypothetical protein